MTRTLSAMSWVLALMLALRGLDYVTGDPYYMGAVWLDNIQMPLYWGAACIATSVVAAYALIRRKPLLLQNTAIFAFAINTMFAVQTLDGRMLPFPWPPEDIRLPVDHLGHAALWLLIAASLWWREGINRRRKQLLEEGEDVQ